MVHGNILTLEKDNLGTAKEEYESAESFVNMGVHPDFLKTFEESGTKKSLVNGFNPSDRCSGLESLKGDILCKSGKIVDIDNLRICINTTIEVWAG
jgi:hypothetical protein